MSDISIRLRDSNLRLNLNDVDLTGVKIISVRVIEQVFDIPRFSIVYSAADQSKYFDMSELSNLSIDIDNGTKFNYTGVVLKVTPESFSGVLIPKQSYFERKSQSFSNKDLGSILQSLNICKSVDMPSSSKISGENTFFQLNETNWECAERLLNLTGQDTLWALTNNELRIFEYKVSNPEKQTIGNTQGYMMDGVMSGVNSPDDLNGRKNFYYGRKNIPLPSACSYPAESIASLVQKTKFKFWQNVSVYKTSPIDLQYSIGDCVKFDWNNTFCTDFIVMSANIFISQGANEFTYGFANFDSWNPSE